MSLKSLAQANEGLQKLAKEEPALVEDKFGYDVPGYSMGGMSMLPPDALDMSQEDLDEVEEFLRQKDRIDMLQAIQNLEAEEMGGIANLMEEPQRMFLGGLAKKLKKGFKKITDDVLGLDPSGKGLIGSIKDNPKTAALLGSLLIPGVGSALTSGLGAAGSARS